MASGLKKMLAQGIANEHKQLEKAATEATKKVENAPVNPESKSPKESPIKENAPASKNGLSSILNDEKATESPKSKCGRPTNKERGLKSRKQYTLTLKEEDYKEFLDRAGEEDLSFAKFMEKAAKEYIENHSS